MRSGMPTGIAYRTPNLDDRVGIGTLWDTFTLVDTGTQDVGTSLNGKTWVTATDNSVWLWNNGSWSLDQSGPSASRIAVDHTGRPWVIAGWGDGSIWRRTTNDPNTGTYEPVPPGNGCARDLGVGVEAGNVSAWVIGCNAGADGQVFKWNAGGWWDWDTGGAWAKRITVDEGGIPWVLTSGGQIWRRTMNDPNLGSWEYLGVISGAVDIGISKGNYLYVLGSGGNVWMWAQQPAGPGNPPAMGGPGIWLDMTKAGVVTNVPANIAVTSDGEPWVVGQNGNLFKTVR
jgi:hypothetical protein